MRYLKALENKDISLVHSMIALVRKIIVINQDCSNIITIFSGFLHDET